MKTLDFLNYELFNDIDEAFTDFTNKLVRAINEIAPLKNIRIKNKTPDWFDGEIIEYISQRDRLFKKFNKTQKS